VTAVRVFASRVVGALTKARRDRRLNNEIDIHLALLTDEFVAQGLSRDEAYAKARREFGGVEAIKDAARDERGLPRLDSLVRDLHFASRLLIRRPLFAAAVVLTVGIGVGANTAVMSVLEMVLLNPTRAPARRYRHGWPARRAAVTDPQQALRHE
jgi:hypothetical protein